MAAFVVIILIVGLVMGAYQARLLDSFFRRSAKNQLVQQARSMEAIIGRLRTSPSSDTTITRNLVSVASSVTGSRVLVTNAHGMILVDSENDQLLGQTVSSDYLSATLRNGLTETFDFPSAGTGAVGAAVPWRTGAHVTGALIFIKPLATLPKL